MNPAAALHSLLTNVEAENSTLTEAWANTLGVEFGSSAFVRRHSEVVALLGDVVKLAQALPETTGEWALRYAPSWWRAVIMPRIDWHSSGKASVISVSDLDHLHSLADLIDGRLAQVSMDAFGGVRVKAEALLEEVRRVESQSEYGQRVLRILEADLEHVLWLIDNVDLFGSSHVVSAVQGALGSAAMATAAVPEQQREGAWKTRMTDFAASVLMVMGLVTPIQAATNEALEQFSVTQELVADIISGEDDAAAGPDDGDDSSQTYPSP